MDRPVRQKASGNKEQQKHNGEGGNGEDIGTKGSSSLAIDSRAGQILSPVDATKPADR